MRNLPYSRRHFLRDGTLLALALPLWPSAAEPLRNGAGLATLPHGVQLRWLDGQPPRALNGVTWGVPWPQGAVQAGSGFLLKDGAREYPLQSWPLAWWPDGSVKWSGHALGGFTPRAGALTIFPSSAQAAPQGNLATETEQGWLVDTGRMRFSVSRGGQYLIDDVWQNERLALARGRLVLRIQSGDEADDAYRVTAFQGRAESVTLEQNGPQRVVIAIRGSHRHDEETRIPFIVRLYCYAGSSSFRVVHTLIYDNDRPQQSVKGIGLAFDVPLQGELHDRHVRFASDEGGVFGEAVRGLTGLRRDPGAQATQAQLNGKATPPVADFAPQVAAGLDYIPAFGSYRLTQHHPDGYQIHKRTDAGLGWLLSATGSRAAGVGYLGSPQGGVAFGIRNFWQSYPACLEIAGAHQERATVTLWLWSPWAEPMDMRAWHGEMGLTTFTAQREALEITYEDYEPGFDTPHGVARTSELFIDVLPSTPDNAAFADLARRVQQPPLLVANAEDLWRARVFGPVWAPADAVSPQHKDLAAQLAWYFDFYRQEVEQRKWYGFWDFGDVMHTYDGDRHVWRYDVGGYAWDNSELSTDLWLWHYFLHSGRPEAFRMAEAMTRHTGEVDVYHLGRFRPLGSRHNVRHWGDSAKQLRISTVANRRFLYYLTADERIGELMDEQIEGVRTLREVMPGRKIGQQTPDDPKRISLYFGTDWSAVAAAWLTAWERRGDPQMRERLLNSMRSIAAQPHGFFTGLAEMDPDTGTFAPARPEQLFISHLSAVFGLAEICSELLQLLPDEGFTRAWLDYCRLYNDLPALSAFVGKPVKKLNLVQGHARLTAFAAWHQQDKPLAARAWREFSSGEGGIVQPNKTTRVIRPPTVLYPLLEAGIDSSIDKRAGSTGDTNLATNAVAQWGLTAMALLALLDAPEPAR
ncbi:Tat pathway signal sequence domain protein [Brenneria goodwinii]|uniref:exo-rhamnogalacturonan lyase family protein n=1 Tax=Brenneria goodwinii TaxID=1109412 RepID=UPI000EF286E0|nr:Tat pathway signal sequence domain protein [Brenneria goodwinii]MCG8158288.1 Tat pathway signal sequence domain protein [Brenneria goodwinii]MCG8162376.1 Tat pathway signal sequence domain protein [Brenneria goodwinii]MCG8167338.1 Tat pathway signal sequence domain protein [Brenneria goodwinii]MCG8171994.1 Tat pathway signal sequence domain protein [Brenneria goodwinii]MCG8175599.1 Tat pathway signal sequence domain protein [Brenneria goodwinii]